jgi:hypothetical protein
MEPIAMSHLGDVVWLSQDAMCDPMGEFGAEADEATRPLPGGSLLQRVAAVSRIAVPKAPPREDPKLVSEPVEVVEPLPFPEPISAVAEASPAASPAAARRGRWFVGVAVLALLTLGQVPFVVLWVLQRANPPAPVAIQVTKPPVAFAITPPLPAERTLIPPPPPPKPVPAVAARPAPAPAGSLSGYLRVEVPVAMRISEDGRLLGTTDVDRLMLPTGDHVLDLRSDELQFSTRLMVTIKAGETSTLPVRLPSASISINAKPWAEAWVDGERVGDTPIGTLMRTIGRHEVVLRHPELGERRVPVLVTLAQPARVSVHFKAGK